MKKRLLILVFAGLMSLVLLPEANASAGYSDVPQEHWAAESIQRATELGYFQGVDEGRFGLGQPISRAAFSSALVRMFGWEEVRPAKSSFDDVDKTRWFYTAAETTLANGAVAAAGQDFRPDDDLTRGEMASMLVRGLGYTSSLAETASSYGVPFSDVTVNRGFITMAYDLGLMKGKDGGRFDPDAPATREQAAAVLVRVYDKLHAASRQVQSAGNSRVVSVSTPMSDLDAAAPATPLEPIAELYRALRNAKNSGADPEKTVLQLTAGGVRTLVAGGRVVSTAAVSAGEVRRILTSEDVSTYYDSRYESAYCIYRPNDAQTATLWYQSGESQAAKLRLARLFGVTRYVLA